TAATATAADAPTTTYTRVRLLMVANGLLDGEGPVHLRLVRVAPEAVLALLQLHVGPRLGAQVGDGGVLVHARPLQVEVVEGGAVEDNEGVRPCLERVDGREGPCLERDREARAALRVELRDLVGGGLRAAGEERGGRGRDEECSEHRARVAGAI